MAGVNSRTLELFRNFFTMSAIGFSVKVVSFFMLPFYTYYLTTEDFALIDLVSLAVQLAIPLFSLSVADSLLRFGLDRRNDFSQVVGSAFGVCLMSFVAAVPAASIVGWLYSPGLGVLVYLMFVLQSFTLLCGAYYKCLDRTGAVVLVSGVVSLIAVLLSVFFIAYLGAGLAGYWAASILAYFAGVCLYGCMGAFRLFGYLSHADRKTTIRLVSYSLPLMPNALFWWLNSSADRYLLAVFATLSDVGLYAAASRLPQLLSTVAGFFFQAWNITAFKNFGSSASHSFFRRMFFMLLSAIYVSSLVLVVCSKFLSTYLLRGSFGGAWPVVPVLVLAVAVSSMNTFLGSVFTSAMRTGPIFYTTAIGSLVNVLLNIVFVSCLGLFGAAIGAVCGCLVMYLMRMIVIVRMFPGLRFDHLSAGIVFVCLVIAVVIVVSGIGGAWLWLLAVSFGSCSALFMRSGLREA